MSGKNAGRPPSYKLEAQLDDQVWEDRRKSQQSVEPEGPPREEDSGEEYDDLLTDRRKKNNKRDTRRLTIQLKKKLCITKEEVPSFWAEKEAAAVKNGGKLRPRFSTDPHIHTFTKDELTSMAKHNESIDSRHPHSLAYRKFLSERSPVKPFAKWMIFIIIGITIGLIGFLMFQCIGYLSQHRRDLLTSIYRSARRDGTVEHYFAAYAAWVGTGVALAFISMLLVKWCPPAGGSGVTDVMAYLNGVFFRKVFNIKTLLAKSISCISAVSSGLPVGPEGPMIHIGAIVGAGIGSGRSKTLKFSFNKLFSHIRNPRDHRDCITAGAAAGVAVAFGAPIGGLLFVMEEVATHWHAQLTPLIFMCSLVAAFTYGLLASQYDGWELRHETAFGGLIDEATILFNSYSDRHMYSRDIVESSIIGAVTGALAVLFTKLNMYFAEKRLRYEPAFKMVEPVLVLIIYLSICFACPGFLPCTDLPEPDNSTISDENGTAQYEEIERLYLTSPCHENDKFSSAASLFWNPGESVIKLLFRKHSPFDIPTMAFFLVVYFSFSCYCCGMQISSGIVIPMLVTGGTVGRLFGRFIHNVIDSTQHEGVYAIIGAAGYFAGVSRLTVSLAVIMIELTNEKRILLPIMCSVMVAKMVGDRFSHSLYHALLQLRAVPFLDVNEMEGMHNRHGACFRAMDICKKQIVVLKASETIESLQSALLACPHQGFPVVDDENRFLGMITRQQLHPLVWNLQEGIRTGEMQEATWSRLALIEEERFVNNDLVCDTDSCELETFRNTDIDLLEHTDTSALTVHGSVSATVAQQLFTSMGLRHLPVINEKGIIMGMITRKDLLACRLEKSMLKSLLKVDQDFPAETALHLDSDVEDWEVFEWKEKESFI